MDAGGRATQDAHAEGPGERVLLMVLTLCVGMIILLSGRDELLSRFSFQFRSVSFADVLGFVASRRELGIGLLGVGFEQLFDLFAAIHGRESALS
jgi:hypothetical protein